MVGPQGIEPRSTVPETVVLSIELQALQEGGECTCDPRSVNPANLSFARFSAGLLAL